MSINLKCPCRHCTVLKQLEDYPGKPAMWKTHLRRMHSSSKNFHAYNRRIKTLERDIYNLEVDIDKRIKNGLKHATMELEIKIDNKRKLIEVFKKQNIRCTQSVSRFNSELEKLITNELYAKNERLNVFFDRKNREVQLIEATESLIKIKFLNRFNSK